MDIRRLRYFKTIADYGSFSAASRRLKVAQPALSRQIRLLEEELGVQLFVRSLNGVEPTEAGERLYRHVQALLHQFGQTREIAQGDWEEVTGQVAIGLPLPRRRAERGTRRRRFDRVPTVVGLPAGLVQSGAITASAA